MYTQNFVNHLLEEAAKLKMHCYTKKQIYLDSDWQIVRNYSEFETLINSLIDQKKFQDIELISFDHDLADQHYSPYMYDKKKYNELYNTFTEKTGLSAAYLLIDKCLDHEFELPEYYCHSMNPVGQLNILGLLDNFKFFRGLRNSTIPTC